MKGKFLILLFLNIFSTLIFSQSFKSDYVCTYSLEYKNNGKSDNEQFIMFIDAKNKKSYFQSSINYAKDTINFKDALQIAGYESDFNEKILYQNDKFTTFEKMIDSRLSCNEDQNLKWTILNQIKKIENVNMQLAKTNAYGRTWYAWFSKDIPIDFGPYKFNGLPGFIVSIYDEKKEFTFSLQKFKKKIKTINIPTSKNYKNIAKKDFNKYRFKIQTADNGVVIFENEIERKKWNQGLEKRFKNIPLLDIEFPLQ